MLEKTFGFPDGTFSVFENVDGDEEESDFEHRESDGVGRKDGEFEGGGSEGRDMEDREYEGDGTDEGGFPEVENLRESNEQTSVTAGSKCFNGNSFSACENVDGDEEEIDFEHGESDGVGRKDGEFGQGTGDREYEGGRTDKGGSPEVENLRESNENTSVTAGSTWSPWDLLRWKRDNRRRWR